MNLLLDTHIALWAVQASPKFSARGRNLVMDEGNNSYVSAVSLWEIGTKFALKRSGPNAIRVSARQARTLFEDAGFALISVTPDHAGYVDHLPPLHRDPFDRLLVAQALSEPLRLVTHDARVAAYSDTVILV